MMVCVTETVVSVAAVLIAGALAVTGGVVSAPLEVMTMLSILTDPCETTMVAKVVPPPELLMVTT